MKKTKLFIAAILILFSAMANAQTKTGFDYFKGKWNVLAAGPGGDVKMVVGFEMKNSLLISTIKDAGDNELYKVEKTTIKENEAIITFVGSQGPVAMVLNKRDDDHLTGDIMGGVVSVAGERIKENK